MAKPYEEIEKDIADKLRKTTSKFAHPDLFVKFGTTKCVLPPSYAKFLDEIDGFEVKDEDVWVVTYPKTGTTWTQEMTWLIAHDLDYNGAKVDLPRRSPFLEFTAFTSEMGKGQNDEPIVTENTMENARQLQTPRVIKSHLPFNMLPKQIRTGEKKPKIIYVAREPKDVCVSFFHHRVMWENYLGTMEDFVEEFIAGLSLYGPYFPHIKEFWEMKDQPNILFLTYEEMKKDLPSVLERVSKFLGKSLSESDKLKLADHLSFENMKNNPAANYDEMTRSFCKAHGTERKNNFIRKGKVGSWKEELSPRQIEMLNSWIMENKIDGLYPIPTNH